VSAHDRPAAEDSRDGLDQPDLGGEEMRRLGYWVVDRVVEHFEHGADGPAIQASTAVELRDALGGPLPEAPGDPLEAMRTLVDVAVANMQHGDHPRYFARVPGPSSYAGVLGDWLATGFNAIATSWGGSSGPSTVELVAVDWLRQLLGLPDGTEGVLTSGGSLANLTALAAARSAVGPGVAYLSDQTHASIRRALGTLGFPPDEVRVLAGDERLRLDAEAVRAAIAADRRRGARPALIIATAGTTNTGAVDDLEGLARLARAEDVWLHVDGAYGAPAALCPAGRMALRGLEHADSLAVDPHKWLFSPYDAGCLFVARPGALADAFGMRPEYLADVRAAPGEVSFGDRGLELTRRARGFKLWLLFRVYGADRLRAAVARGLSLAEYAQRLLGADPAWEVVTPAQLAIVTFTRRGWSPGRHADAVAAVAASGYAAVTSTRLQGRSVLRLCTINPRTTEGDIEQTLHRLASATRD
jgi:glutamate/tyrosine decarboxylase-like PLP-dependent enzyme